ncbi:sodium:solute symporter family protein [candidate division KSB1 bacterium]
MLLSFIDWLIIGAYLLLSLIIGLSFRKKAGKSLTDFFLSGRNLPWYVAGISMVATTFAADTPLAVTELVAKNGISGNWIWWNMLIGGMLTTFFFAKLWRRADVLTELELIEKRYSGIEAGFLRGFKSLYLGIFMNALIIGWVNLALMTIIKVFFNLPDEQLIWYVAAAMLITVIYSTLSGLSGVAFTDVIQFIIAMTGTTILAVLVLQSDKVGGISGLKSQLPDGTLNFFPRINSQSSATEIASTFTITVGAFLAFISVQWWASWYPGAEPGGGGYVAQRMMSTKSEKHSVFATLLFQILNYTVRPWPWILVGLATLVLYPGLGVDEKKLGYVMAMNDYLPVGLKGLLLVAFLAAYMSTISTQLNWGSSYIVNDLYKRFIKPESRFKNTEQSQKHYVLWGRIFTLIIMLIGLFVTTLITTISGVWEFILECGAGLGMVLILRWYWWRINAWSEIVATIAPFFAYAFSKFYLEGILPSSFVDNKGSFFITVGFTTIAWLVVTFITKPTNKNKLQEFYNEVKPEGAWNPFRKETTKSNMVSLIICWLSAISMTYSVLFMTGKILFHEWQHALIWGSTALVSLIILVFTVNKSKVLKN